MNSWTMRITSDTFEKKERASVVLTLNELKVENVQTLFTNKWNEWMKN